MSMKKHVLIFSKSNPRSGFSILEPLLAASLIAFLVLGLMSALVYGRATVADNTARAKALFLAEEGLEAVRSIRTEGFSDLEQGVYGLSGVASVWSLSSEPDALDGFERTIEIADMDDSSKSITASIEWSTEYGRSTVSLETRLYDWQQI